MKFQLFDSSKKITPIYFIIRKERKGHKIFLKYPTGISIKPEYWNKKKERVRELNEIPSADYNNTLDIIEREVKIMFRDNDYFSLTSGSIRAGIDAALERGSGASRDEFLIYLDAIIKKKPVYSQLKDKLLPYKNLNWSTFTKSFLEDFVADLETEGMKRNSISKQIKMLKAVLNAAFDDGTNKYREYKKFSYKPEQIYNVYLNDDELDEFAKVELSKALGIIRDLIIIGCYTGMRVDNYLNIDPNINIDLKSGFITAIVNKNGPRVEIPIHWRVRKIIEKHNGMPPHRSVWAINRGIKKIGQLAGITKNEVFAKTVGGVRKQFVMPKFKMLSSHTCRRTLVTNLYLQGVGIKYIMSITGHKTEAQCIAYIKAGMNEMAAKVSELSYWKEPEI